MVNHYYDYIFCGSGASASLLLLQMHQKGLLKDQKILLIDPDEKKRRDKTFCFWAEENDSICQDLRDLISCKWSEVQQGANRYDALYPLQYNHISSVALYDAISGLVSTYRWDRRVCSIENIFEDHNGPYLSIDNEIFHARVIFDSRPPVFMAPQGGETHIYQSFVGWIIDCERDIKNPNAFRFMDFEIDQNDATQFVYVLPLNHRKALVEVTRFGEKIITRKEADAILGPYIRNEFAPYVVSDMEEGCIPMTNAQCIPIPIRGVVPLGARNLLIKPSTGYAFKNMHRHAMSLAGCIETNQMIVPKPKVQWSIGHGRFALYDALLLDILKNKPHFGKPIFKSLIQNVDIRLVLKFLDEKTNIREELSLFKHLPWGVFLGALGRRFLSSPALRSFILVLISCLWIAYGTNDNIEMDVAYVVILIGMIAIGIPHGALDHMVNSEFSSARGNITFIVKYLLLAGGIAILWCVSPVVAFTVFMIFSAWHFGQSDGSSWGLSKGLSFVWGLFLLSFLLGTHQEESNSIIANMGLLSWPFTCSPWVILPWFVYASYKRNGAFILCLTWVTLSIFLPLVLAFSLYFIGEHSFKGWFELRSHLKLNHKKMWLMALPFHAGAWFLLCCVYLGMTYFPAVNQFNWIASFFIFISCISFPHVIAMNGVYKSNYSEQRRS